MSPETEFTDVNMSDVYREEKTFENGEIMNPRSPFTLNIEGRGNFPLVQMVCREIVMTERSYVNDLKEVIEGYIYHLKKYYRNEDIDIFDIFGNLEDIYEFNKEVLYQIEECEVNENEIDPIKLANVFCEKTSGFNKHYTQYCTEYPEAASTLRFLMQDKGVANFFSERQSSIGHALSLESYLLKPVQRILKYNLLLKDILKKYRGNEDGYKIINTALDAMSDVAEYINEMKRLHENARQVDEILENIVDIDEPPNRYATGKFVLENSFKIQGVRGDRTIILFEKLLIMGKKTEDKQLQFKDRMECSNMMLLESMPKEPLGFQLLRFDSQKDTYTSNQKDTYTIVAKTFEIKKEWTQHLKRLILENHAAKIPQTARHAILGEEQAKSKYDSLPMQALDNTGSNTLRKPIPKGSKSPNIKDNVSMTTGVKRESNEKDSSKEPKRHSRIKEEKKNRSNVTSPTGATSAEKEKKEKLRYFRRHKHKPSLDSIPNMETNTEELNNNNNYIPQDNLLKSRSLESLKDILKVHDEMEFKPPEEPGDTPVTPECVYEADSTEKANNNSIRHRSYSTINGPLTYHKSESIGEGITEESETTEAVDTFKENNYTTETYSPDLRCESVSDKKNEMLNEPVIPMTKPSIDDETGDHVTKQLESQLSHDDKNSSSQIKNLVSKVSNALHNSFHMYTGSPTNPHTPSNGMTPMFFSPTQSSKKYRKSTGTMQNSDVFVESPVERSSSAQSVFNEKNVHDDGVILESESESDTITTSNELLPIKPDEYELTESDDNAWSTNVDALFYEVNADLDSIAGSIASDTAKSNESGSDVNNTPTDSSTSIGIDIIEKASDIDQPIEETNGLIIPTENLEQVKQVADRIKEYKRLVDAEKRRHSWTQREPRNINEMIESLDSIQTDDNALSPTYSSLRRRFRPSRDYGTGRDIRPNLEICNETSRAISPSQGKLVDGCVHETPFIELDTKSGELVSQMQSLGSSKLETTFEVSEKNDEVFDDTHLHDHRERSSSSYEYIEAVLKTPDLVSTADLISTLTPKCLDGHLLAEQNSLENVFYTQADDKLRKPKSNSLPAAMNTKETTVKAERKLSDTTNVVDKTSIEPLINLSAYNNLLSEGESVAKRTEVYFRALKNLEQHKRKPAIQKPKTPSFTTCDFSPSLIACDHPSNMNNNENVLNTPVNSETILTTPTKESDTPQINNRMVIEKDDNEKLYTSSTENNENLTECQRESTENNENLTDCPHESAENNENLTDCPHESAENNENLTECQRESTEKVHRTDRVEKVSPCEQENKENLNECGQESNDKIKSCPSSNIEKVKPCQENIIEKLEECDERINEKTKVFHLGNDESINEKTKVFRIGNEGSIHEKKVFRIDKQKMKSYQTNNIEKKQPNENIEKIKLCRIGCDEKTLICRLDIVEKTVVSRQDEKISCPNENKFEIDKIRVFQQNSSGKVELNCENSNSTSNSNNCQTIHETEAKNLRISDSRDQMNNRRSKSVSVLPPKGLQIHRPQSRFTTETFINLDKRSLKKSNSTPPETSNNIKPPSLEKGKNDESSMRNNAKKLTSKINKPLTYKKPIKAPDIFERTPPISKRVTRSCSLPSVNGICSYNDDKEKARVKREQINQLKSKLDSCAVEESPRGRSSSKNCTEEIPTYQRSTSLPRRKTNFLIIPNEDVEEAKKTEKYVLRSPSIRNIQQNHVNNRIKDYFVNLQKSSEISRSRPNLLLVGNSSSGSDSESSTEENECNLPLTDNNEDNVQIYRGTVRSMIKKYGQVNFVFD